MRAQLIGEKSGGMTAVEIYGDGGDLVWSHRWFDAGCAGAGYVDGLCDALDCIMDCADVYGFDGGEVDDDGDAVAMDTESTTGVMLEYDTAAGWSLGEAARTHGQSAEIVDALMLAGLLGADAEHPDHADDPIVRAIFEHIVNRSAA